MADRAEQVLQVDRLSMAFASGRRLLPGPRRGAERVVRAVSDVNFSIGRGETFALIGESGSGKTTIARCVSGILPPTSGRVMIMDQDLAAVPDRKSAIRLRRNLQMIFQDPYASLNPRWRAFDSIAEPLRTHRLAVGRQGLETRVFEMLGLVGLSPEDGRKFPHQFSGGQRQRVCIARALAAEPAFVIADEPTSALDVSIQAQILNLMRDLQVRLGLTYLFISHNLAVVSNMAHTIGVLYAGRLVEMGPARQLLSRPRHPYTRLLVDAVPDLDAIGRLRPPVRGDAPDPAKLPSGCAFHPRCPLAVERCRVEIPAPRSFEGVEVACHRAEDTQPLPAPAERVPALSRLAVNRV